jgi:lysophospholipase L1-like esterase
VRKAAAVLLAAVMVLAVAWATLPDSVHAAPRAAAAPRAKPKTILVFGDSVALTLGVGILRWGKQHGIVVHNEAVLGCSLMDDNLVQNYSGTVRRPPDACHTRKDWPALLRKFHPDASVALFGGNDVYNMSWDNGHTWSWAGKPVFKNHFLAIMRNASTRLASRGGNVLWVTPPCFAYIKGDTGSTPTSPWYDRRRVAALGTMLHTVASTTHQSVTDVIHTAGCPVNFTTRPDGVHFSRAGADAMMTKLGPVILRALAS